jgi:hypothetical protein
MNDNHPSEKDDFLYPRVRYQDDVSPQNVAFNGNLQKFAIKVICVCALEANGEMASQEAHEQIKALWKNLKQS